MNWYYAVLNSPHHGPFSEEDMRRLITEKAIDGATLVWNGTLPKWQKFSETSLASHLENLYAPPTTVRASPTPPPLPHVAITPVVSAPVDQVGIPSLPQQEQSVAPVFPPLPEKSSGVVVEWYYSDGNKQHGPVSETEIARLIQDGRITSKFSLWNSSMADWEPVSNTGFSSVLPSSEASLPFTDAEYLIIAKKFTVLIRVFLGGILLAVLGGMVGISQNLLIALEALIGILFLIFVYQVADSLKSKFVWLFVVLCFIPFASLLVLIFLNHEVKKALKLRGIKVGFLGVSSADLASIQRN